MIFADTTALFALLRPDDRHHSDATRAAVRFRDHGEEIWTIDPVLTELWVLLRRDVGVRLADQYLAELLERGLRREPIDGSTYARCWAIAADWPDQRFSLTDRQCFDAIERSGHLSAWSYDDDFVVIRLAPRRSRAITVYR